MVINTLIMEYISQRQQLLTCLSWPFLRGASESEGDAVKVKREREEEGKSGNHQGREREMVQFDVGMGWW